MTQYGPYTAHRIADKWRLLPDAEIANIAASIERDGQAIPIGVWGGVLVDGRNRWRACERAGIEPLVEERTFKDDAECGRWIIAVNKDRRHDTPSQLALLASDPEVMALYREEIVTWPCQCSRCLDGKVCWQRPKAAVYFPRDKMVAIHKFALADLAAHVPALEVSL